MKKFLVENQLLRAFKVDKKPNLHYEVLASLSTSESK